MSLLLPLLPQHTITTLRLNTLLSSTGATLWEQIKEEEVSPHLTLSPLTVAPDGGHTEAGGSRLKGPPGQPGQLNGMPSKKSHSTSKLSAKGEQGNYT